MAALSALSRWPRPVCLFCAAASHAVALRSPYCVCMHAHSQTHPHTHTQAHTGTHTCRHTHMQAGRQAGRQRHAGSSIDVAILMAMFHAPLSAKFNARRKYAVSPAPHRPAPPLCRNAPCARPLLGLSVASRQLLLLLAGLFWRGSIVHIAATRRRQ